MWQNTNRIIPQNKPKIKENSNAVWDEDGVANGHCL